ncbi:MAG: hypothetical protein AB9917_19730 [Negativicutes bacterium]
MENLINYLHEVLDENSTLKPFEEAERLLIFLREIYQVESVIAGGKNCVLLFFEVGSY